MYGFGIRSSLPGAAGNGTGAAAAVLDEDADREVPAAPDAVDGRVARAYVCDNSVLGAREPGITFRFTKASQDRDVIGAVAPWGSTVWGVDEGDGWLSVGDRFLPMTYMHARILVPAEEALIAEAPTVLEIGDFDGDVRNAFLRVGAEQPLVSLRTQVPAPLISRRESRPAAELEAGLELCRDPRMPERFLCDNSALQAHADGIAYRFSKDMQDRDLASPLTPWGSSVEGVDEGDGWVKVGYRYLPIAVNGATVLVRQESAGSAVPSAGPSSGGRVRRVRPRDHYAALGVGRLATCEEISQAFRATSVQWHPDKMPVDADEAVRAAASERMAELSAAHHVLSDAGRRWEYDRRLPPERGEVTAAAAAAATAAVLPTGLLSSLDPDPSADCDFDFSGGGRPFRMARGRAARVRGGRDGIRLARAQLRGKDIIELVDKSGLLVHAGPLSPFGALGIAGLLAHADVRPRLRDFAVERVREMARTSYGLWGASGFRYAALGAGELLFHLELLERVRASGVPVAQICLTDLQYLQPTGAVRQALREFADWQRASAQLSQQPPAELLVFGSVEDFRAASAQGGRAAGCHLLLDCAAPLDGTEAQADPSELNGRALGALALASGGLLVRLTRDAADAWVKSGPGAENMEALQDPLLSACSSAVSDLDVRFWAQLRADAREEALRAQLARELQLEKERREQDEADRHRAALRREQVERQSRMHDHPLAKVGTLTWVPTKQWRCDCCGSSSVVTDMVRFRCSRGCNVDLCDKCYSTDAAALAEEQTLRVEAAGHAPLLAAETSAGEPPLSLAQQRARARLRARQEAAAAAPHFGAPLPGLAPAADGVAAERSLAAPVLASSVGLSQASRAGGHAALAAIASVGGAVAPRSGRSAAAAPRRAVPRRAVESASLGTVRALDAWPTLDAGGPDMELRKRAQAEGGHVWRVVHGPHVAVRIERKNTAKTLCLLYPGEEVLAESDSDSLPGAAGVPLWLRLSGLPGRLDARIVDGAAWILVDNGDLGLGRLLEPI